MSYCKGLQLDSTKNRKSPQHFFTYLKKIFCLFDDSNWYHCTILLGRIGTLIITSEQWLHCQIIFWMKVCEKNCSFGSIHVFCILIPQDDQKNMLGRKDFVCDVTTHHFWNNMALVIVWGKEFCQFLKIIVNVVLRLIAFECLKKKWQ